MKSLSLHLEVHLQDLCSCHCFRLRDHEHVVIDQNFQPRRYIALYHGPQAVQETYGRIHQMLQATFADTLIDGVTLIDAVQEISAVPLHDDRAPLSVEQLKRILSAIEQLCEEEGYAE